MKTGSELFVFRSSSARFFVGPANLEAQQPVTTCVAGSDPYAQSRFVAIHEPLRLKTGLVRIQGALR